MTKENKASLTKGQFVQHPNKPDWGTGEIIEVQSDERVRVNFFGSGFKIICTNLITLSVVEPPRVKNARQAVDIDVVRPLCDYFYSEMTSNRRNSDDGKLAKNITRDLERFGVLRPATRTQLLHWCHSDGAVYQKGVPIARQICNAIYGCIPPKEW